MDSRAPRRLLYLPGLLFALRDDAEEVQSIEYAGEEVRRISHKHLVRISGEQKAGLQFFWSSDRHLTELVPAQNLFH